ncbi:hypothetical protein IH779_03425 [Patescibacteria group bacterium]|nr:hypothetical protein [Patescibacteria group bacterium]
MNLLSRMLFLWKRPKIIIVAGKGRALAAEAIFQVLKQKFKVEKITGENFSFLWNEILIFETKLEKIENLHFFVKNSKAPIFLITNVGEIPPDKYFFAGARKETEKMRKLIRILPSSARLVLNFDDETIRELGDDSNIPALTFGFQEGVDLRASDLHFNHGINFKINYKGNVVPVWLDSLYGKEQIYGVLAAVVCGVIFDFNLVEVSQALKFYKGLPGKMRLMKGIKNSWLLDDSATSSVFSMIEALEILGKIEIGQKKKIAVLGDILGIGKYTIEAHEVIGEKVAKSANLLFTIGSRAKFIAQGAKNNGFPEESIFQFDDTGRMLSALKTEIKEKDLVLIDGSTEIRMDQIVQEIQARG